MLAMALVVNHMKQIVCKVCYIMIFTGLGVPITHRGDSLQMTRLMSYGSNIPMTPIVREPNSVLLYKVPRDIWLVRNQI